MIDWIERTRNGEHIFIRDIPAYSVADIAEISATDLWQLYCALDSGLMAITDMSEISDAEFALARSRGIAEREILARLERGTITEAAGAARDGGE